MPAKRTSQKRVKAQRKAKPKNVVRAKAKGGAKPKNAVRVKAKAKARTATRPKNVVRAKTARKPKRAAAPPPRNVVVETVTAAPIPKPLGENEIEVSGVWGVVRVNEADPDAETREIFDHYDRDGSGRIDASELARLCEALGMEMEEHELKVAILDVDADADGKVGWSEFLRWWKELRD